MIKTQETDYIVQDFYFFLKKLGNIIVYLVDAVVRPTVLVIL